MAIHRRLEDLVTEPQEGLDVEIKPWLDLTTNGDRANLAQALLAIANHGGGFVVLGFAEENGGWQPAAGRPSDLSAFSQDVINGIVQKYAEPAFHCEVQFVEHRQTKDQHPVVVVPGDHRVPIRSRSAGPDNKHVAVDTYYVRRPGPTSEPPRSGREWDELIGRCVRNARDELLGQLRVMLAPDSRAHAQETLATRLESWRRSCRRRFDTLVKEVLAGEQPSRYAHGVWTFTYVVDGSPVAGNLSELRDLLDKVRGHETGWAPWWVPTRDGIKPYSKDGLIECWLAEPGAEGTKDPGVSDFWRASPEGKMFLLRGYQEDGEDGETHGVAPGAVLDVALPIWRVGECLLHARRLASTVDDDAQVAVGVTWEGLKGRQLVSWARPRRLFFDARTCKEEDSVESFVATKANEIRAILPDLVRRLTAPFYEAFDFFSPPERMVESELDRMLQGRG